MPRFILTGAPGSGKTVILRALEMRGFGVVEEAVQFHDRSAVCTLALARYLGFAVSLRLKEELRRIETEAVYERRVFFIEKLGFVAPTEARRISFEETLKFERIHEETYREMGYELVRVKAGPVEERVAEIVRVETQIKYKCAQ